MQIKQINKKIFYKKLIFIVLHNKLNTYLKISNIKYGIIIR